MQRRISFPHRNRSLRGLQFPDNLDFNKLLAGSHDIDESRNTNTAMTDTEYDSSSKVGYILNDLKDTPGITIVISYIILFFILSFEHYRI